MKRNAFLITAVLLSMTSAAIAAEQKQDSQSQQSDQTEKVQLARKTDDVSTEYASPAKAECMPKPNPKNMHSDAEGDPQASQNQVEYGGAG
jgi:hypothetical protein